VIKKDPEAEQRLILAVLLSVGVYWIWMGMFPPAQPPAAPVAETVQTEPGSPPSTETVEVVPAVVPATSEVPVPVVQALPERSLPLRTDNIDALLTSEGGGLANISLPGRLSPFQIEAIWSRAIDMVMGDAEEDWRPWGEEPGPEILVGEAGVLLAAGAGEGFVVERHAIDVGSTSSATLNTRDGIEVTRRYATTDDPNTLRVEVTFTHRGADPWSGPLWIGALDEFSGEANRYSNVARPVLHADGDLEKLEDLDDVAEGPDVQEGEVAWFGIADRYFLAAAIPDAPWGQGIFAPTFDGRHGAFLVENANLMPGQSQQVSLDLYIGSMDLDALAVFGPALEDAVDFGIFGFFSKVLLFVLQGFHSLVGNWGLAIILLTLVVKLTFWPLTKKSFASGRKMQALQPKIQAMKEKFPDDSQRQGQEQMKLFKEEGVNPLGGCIPMLVQMPVWFALYSVLLFSADVYHAEFLYVRDLSSPDPWGILPTLVGVLMVLQQRLTPMSPNMDPTQQKIMRMMPLIFVVIMYSFPSGLALYILVNTILSILQMWLVNRAYPMVPATPATQKA